MLDAPIRSVLFGETRFAQHGESLAAAQGSRPSRGSDTTFFPRLADNSAVLRSALATLDRSASQGRHLSPAAQWLLDNAAMLDEQLLEVKLSLPRRFYRRLPVLSGDAMRGLPRIYGIAWAWVAHTDSGFDEALLTRFVNAYQSVAPLMVGELAALHTTLRVVLVENLRRLGERVVARNAARDAAHAWMDRAVAQVPPRAWLRALERRGVLMHFLLTLWQRLEQVHDVPDRDALMAWVAQQLPDPTALLAAQQNESGEDQQSIRNAITTLHTLSHIDWSPLMQACSQTLRILMTAPVHAGEDATTRNRTLRHIERLARHSARSEADVARELVALTGSATHPDEPPAACGYWCDGDGENALRARLGLAPRRWPRRASRAWRRVATPLYLLSIGALLFVMLDAVMVSAAGAPPWLWWLVLVCAAAPASEACVAIISRLVSESVAPMRLARLALAGGLDARHRCMVVLPVLLASTRDVARHVAQLEQHALANPEREAQFALLSDFADADAAHLPGDEALLEAARQAIEDLNRRHAEARAAVDQAEADAAPRFLLLHRERQWSDSEQRWIGWERKRGKLDVLVRALAEPGDTCFAGTSLGGTPVVPFVAAPFVDLGAASRLRTQVRYLITLDADTDLLPGRLRQLIGIAAHPLNRPRYDAQKRRVVSGYGIVQPRVDTPLPQPEAVTYYHALFNGQCGLDPYSAAASELYQDLFGEGSFSGKGLLDVQAVHRSLTGRFPDGRLLSHDLIEGSLARCAAASDVNVVEDAPLHADVAASRLHRWTRGDWQLLPYVFGAGGIRLSGINRWKMLDNLRRSLVAPGSLALVLLSLVTGAPSLAAALAVVVAAFAVGPLIGAVAAAAPARDDIAFARFFAHAGAELVRSVGLALWHVVQLLSLALLYGDAIVRALWRRFVSHRLTLQWTTAEAAQAAASTQLSVLWRRHARVPLAALAIGVALALAWWNGWPVDVPAAATLVVLWGLAPLATWWVSVPRPRPRYERLASDDETYLRTLARHTWRFYERHVGPQDLHLPPDNVQLVPRMIVAHRTSPTNIGLYLLSVACARELAFIGSVEMAERIHATLDAVERLPKHHGHVPNWIDTVTGKAMLPCYVSAVDSGNLAAALLVLARACAVTADRDARPAATLAALRALLHQAQQTQQAHHAQHAQRAQQAHQAGTLHAAVDAIGATPRVAGAIDPLVGLDVWPPQAEGLDARLELIDAARAELEALVEREHGDAAAAGGGGGAASPAWALLDLVTTLRSHLRDAIADTSGAMAATRDMLRDAARRARRLALAMDFRLLYDNKLRLLHIGLDVATGRLDRGHYDLMASEARLTSLMAIAKGDVPAEHWQALGRPFGASGRGAVLRSWSGSMFEYLMPALVLDEPQGSALEESARVAVAEQQREARAHATPWGISESAIALQDQSMAYQYGPQGVARLALRRTPGDERVIAPYATGLALLVDPHAAVDNLRALEALGARRACGFIESIDFSPQRQAEGGTRTLVHTHMAHHQAMIFVAATALLSDRAPQAWGREEPHLRAVAGLLHERAPHEIQSLRDRPAPPPARRGSREPMVSASVPLRHALAPTQWLGNRRYGVVLRANGAGWSQCLGQGLTRWRDDALRDDRGTFVYLRRSGGARCSLTAHPAADPTGHYVCRMQPDRAIFDYRAADLEARTTVWVSPEDDCELREVLLVNVSDRTLDVTIELAAEPTLTPHAADAAHPAFSNLFIEASWDASDHALWLRRRPRLDGDVPWRAVYALASVVGSASTLPDPAPDVRACADRLRWLGRYGSTAQPAGLGAADAGIVRNALVEVEAAREDDAPPAGEVAPPPAGETNSPLPSEPNPPLPGGALHTGLDPMAVIAVRRRIRAGESCRLTFVAAAGTSQEMLESLVDKYHQPQHVERASNLSHTMASILLHDMRIDAASWAALLHLQTLLSGLHTRELPAEVAACDRRALWRHGIGGDRPMLVVTVRGEAGLPLVQTLLRATTAWTVAGQGVDLVVINGEPLSYLTPVRHQLQQWLPPHDGQDQSSRPSVKLLREADLDAVDRVTLAVLARVRLQADGRPLAEQVDRLVQRHDKDAAARARGAGRVVETPWRPAVGGATARPAPVDTMSRPAPVDTMSRPAPMDTMSRPAPMDTMSRPSPVDMTARPSHVELPRAEIDRGDGTCRFTVSTTHHTPRPWVNVLANPRFGRHISEAGGGHLWAGNSRMHQITRWHNDPVCDTPGDWLLLEDADSRRVWPLGRALQGAAPRRVEHGIGFTRQTQRLEGVEVTLEWCVDAHAALTQCRVALRSSDPQPRRLRLIALVEWTMGASSDARSSVLTRRVDHAGGAVLAATQLDASGGFGGATAWLAVDVRGSSGEAAEWTCDRREFIDTQGRLVLPSALGRRAGAGLDPCAALGQRFVVDRHRDVEATLLLGHVDDPSHVVQAVAAARATSPAHRLEAQRALWRELGSALRVRTPDAAFDAMVNHWLPYQTIACRLWARAGYDQAGGAFGFRDQLQDAMSMLALDPTLLAKQLRTSAARQFAEGDVQHWWHEPGGAGVRTHFSDDRVWLPFALAHYVERTGDAAIADDTLPFIEGRAVPEGAEDVYETPTVSTVTATLYEHAARALDRSLFTSPHARFAHCPPRGLSAASGGRAPLTGSHGLPLMGSGDWNDGMNRVGYQGQGESVWLAWFVCATIDAMLPLASRAGDEARQATWRDAREQLAAAIDTQAWDGRWYRRATFDDGSWLGSAANAECRIDLIAQAWAVMSGAGSSERAGAAMDAAARHLWDRDAKLLRLLTPPLRDARPAAGYIQSYPPGVRENGGQYNHAAVWGVIAAASLGQHARAWDWWRAISAAHRCSDAAGAHTYGGEPFVVAGDVWTAPPYVGRCGWSWYTGSAGWLWRAGVESLCGVHQRAGEIRIDPCLPPGWAQVDVHVGALHLRLVSDAHAARIARADRDCRGALAARRWLPIAALQTGGFHLVDLSGDEHAPQSDEGAAPVGLTDRAP